MVEDMNNPYSSQDKPTTVSDNQYPAGFTPNPTVLPYQRIYVLLMFALYTFLFIGVVYMATDLKNFSQVLETTPNELTVMLVFLGIPVFFLAIVFLVGLFWNRGLGGWIYNLILICLGLTSGCTWPITIPLMIFWIKQKDDIQYSHKRPS